ncbi:uncharacterized protein LOC127870716 [Dreissena polymorpha]|uniref:Uncharacterized protein n=1 Tax=Dreissena polymorpha TaxID=45954 RepID=A0A9D4L9F4_DREPO|nr:uncharacterized protein LOC127870716 [Dreissena polymorpha]KAH3854273.1 hypothetical protein DPMN_096811 [Dreissena polymorpha]
MDLKKLKGDVEAGGEHAPRDNEKEEERSDEEERNNDEDERSERFVETRDKPEILKIKSLNQNNKEMAPFYFGDTLDNRMAEIRKSIYHIRNNWSEFQQFQAALKNLLLEDDELDFKDKETRIHCAHVLTADRDWLTLDEAHSKDLGYEAIKLYTSKEGHAKIYRLANAIFRQKAEVSAERIRSVVFLIELINIDLFNYCQKDQTKVDFRGTVYRGIAVTEEDLQAFKDLRNQPIANRNIAVPLGLFASSSKLKVAKRFIRKQIERADPATPLIALLLKIHVIGVKPEYVAFYKRRFPNAELTTICAVDIHEISQYPGESEVLLRGPFKLILDMYRDETMKIAGQAPFVVEAVMLNANRDHISTSTCLGEDDALARDLFAAMVTETRSEFAAAYCLRKGLSVDQEEYTNIAKASKEKLNELMKK